MAALCAVATLGATGCVVELGEGDDPPAAAVDVVRWDLREPTPLSELGDTDGMVVESTLGRSGLDVEVLLPEGIVVDGSWSDVSAIDDGVSDRVGAVLFGSRQFAGRDWVPLVDEFVARFGGDRAEIDAHVAAATAKLAAGDVALGRSFEGDRVGAVVPAVWVRVLGDPADPVVSVRWDFTLDG